MSYYKQGSVQSSDHMIDSNSILSYNNTIIITHHTALQSSNHNTRHEKDPVHCIVWSVCNDNPPMTDVYVRCVWCVFSLYHSPPLREKCPLWALRSHCWGHSLSLTHRTLPLSRLIILHHHASSHQSRQLSTPSTGPTDRWNHAQVVRGARPPPADRRNLPPRFHAPPCVTSENKSLATPLSRYKHTQQAPPTLETPPAHSIYKHSPRPWRGGLSPMASACHRYRGNLCGERGRGKGDPPSGWLAGRPSGLVAIETRELLCPTDCPHHPRPLPAR